MPAAPLFRIAIQQLLKKTEAALRSTPTISTGLAARLRNLARHTSLFSSIFD